MQISERLTGSLCHSLRLRAPIVADQVPLFGFWKMSMSMSRRPRPRRVGLAFTSLSARDDGGKAAAATTAMVKTFFSVPASASPCFVLQHFSKAAYKFYEYGERRSREYSRCSQPQLAVVSESRPSSISQLERTESRMH